MSNERVTRARSDGAPINEYTIAELATLFGVSYRTLRFYDQKGLLRPARRGTQRIFSEKDRVRLSVIMLAKRLGFSLTDTRDLIESRSIEPQVAPDAPASVASLGLSRSQICERVDQLTRERESLQQAIDELRRAAPGIGCLA